MIAYGNFPYHFGEKSRPTVNKLCLGYARNRFTRPKKGSYIDIEFELLPGDDIPFRALERSVSIAAQNTYINFCGLHLWECVLPFSLQLCRRVVSWPKKINSVIPSIFGVLNRGIRFGKKCRQCHRVPRQEGKFLLSILFFKPLNISGNYLAALWVCLPRP